MNQIKIFLLIVIMSVFTCILNAQKRNEFVITGTIVDHTNASIPGVNVIVKNQPGFGSTSNIDGSYKIKAQAGDVLQFSFIGFDVQEVIVSDKNVINISLQQGSFALDEAVVVGSGVQRKVSVVGAITSVDVKELKIPSSNLSNALAGNVAGIISMQKGGEPGDNVSEFWIRGISTFGANSSALVLVDGIERDFNQVSVEDIASFSVLKDASATAIYGQRGANGVIIITTKRGESGKVKINTKVEYGVSTPSRMPKYVDGVTYAEMANEARLVRGEDPKYSESEIDIIRYGLDPDIYPNVDWYDEVLEKVTSNQKVNVSFSGGGTTARYYLSGSYLNEGGMYKTTNMQDYNTNANFKRYNFRSNVDVNLTQSTVLEFGVGGWITDRNKPGSSADDIWKSLVNLTAITVPVRYSNGLFPTYGTGNVTNPSVLLNETGYITQWENKMETNVGIKQNLSMITEGLMIQGRFSYDAYNWSEVKRLKMPMLFRAETQRDGNGQMVMRKMHDGHALKQETGARGDRRYYSELNFNYERLFADKHRVTALLLYYLQDKSVNDAGGNVFKAIPNRNMALSGRATYSFNDRYMLEGNFGYTGTENFEKSKRFGFFPAIAAGWVVSNEKIVKEKVSWMNLLKFRVSYGEVGNDRLPNDVRFPYITTIVNDGNYKFGEYGQTNVEGLKIDKLGTPNLTWEVAQKYNFGIDLGLFNKFTATVELFKDSRKKIFMKRGSMPFTVGLDESQIPWANVGRMESKGMEGVVSYTDKLGDITYALRGNITYTYTKVIDYDEATNSLSYQMTKGYRLDQTRGFNAIGLFANKEDIDNSPKQFETPVLPGDIKYKDVNGDGVINDKDKVPIGYSHRPGVVYGFGASLEWNGFDFNILMQGAGNSDFFVGGYNDERGDGVFPFNRAEIGNVMEVVANASDRWIPRELSGNPASENPDAIFPRLTYGKSDNNSRESTFWLRNGRYLRLKNLTLGYTLPHSLLQKYKVESVRFYIVGTNLAVWDTFGWWDPELTNEGNKKYPIQKSFTFGLTVNF